MKIKFSTQLSELYGRDKYQSHIELNREYWYCFGSETKVYKHTKQSLNKIKISYIRSGIAFYVLSNFPDFPEGYFPLSCFMASALKYAEIDPMKDLPLSDEHNQCTKEYLEKMFCFDDEVTTVINWNNSKETELELKPEQYSPLCDTVKDKIREYIANHFIADTVVKTDIKSIVKAMEEGVRLGKESQKPAEWSEEDKKKIYFLSRLIELQVKDEEYCFGEGFRMISKQEAIEMLKSLRPSWKPSEELLDALHTAAYLPEMELYRGIKDKLRELDELLRTL